MDAKTLLEGLKEDLFTYNDAIKEVAKEIIENKLSHHPVFIAHQAELKIGEPILQAQDFGTTWSINASTAEQLVEIQLIKKENFEQFADIYKDPTRFMCILLISEKGGNFIFHPYK